VHQHDEAMTGSVLAVRDPTSSQRDTPRRHHDIVP
jgi:hypothetical protein